MLLATAAWWCLLFTVLFAPSATLLLFHVADPRKGPWDDRITLRESLTYLWSEVGRAWKLAGVTLPAVALIAFNLRYYGSSDGVFTLLAPIWLLLLIVGVAFTFTVFAVGGVTDLDAGSTLRTGLRIVAVRLPAALLVILITFVIPLTILTSVLYFLLPIVLALPGLIAIAMSRFALSAMGEAIPEPNKPTEERLHEKT
jgi:hypothetical protein